MKFVDPILPSDDEEITQLEASLKKSSGWKPKNERRRITGFSGRGDRDYDPNPMAWRE
jgi:hypothetical protein